MSNLTNRLNSLWSMLEEEGYYTKANTAMLARNRIEELEAKLAKAVEIAELFSGGVEYDYHGNIIGEEEQKAMVELEELKEDKE